MATVNGMPITQNELMTAIKERLGDNFSIDKNPGLAKTVTLKQLIAEKSADSLVSDEVIRKNPQLGEELGVARRRILLRFYLHNNLSKSVALPTEGEVSDFMKNHPEYSTDRKVYHYAEMSIRVKSDPQMQEINRWVDTLQEARMPDPDRFWAYMDQMAASGVEYGFNKKWEASDAMDKSTFERLKALEKSQSKIAVERNGRSFRIFALFAAYPDPMPGLQLKKNAFQTLVALREAQQLIAASNEIFSRQKIAIYDKSIKDLSLPKYQNARVVEQSNSGHDLIAVVWCVTLVITLVFAFKIFSLEKKFDGEMVWTPTEHALRIIDGIVYGRLFRALIAIGAFALVAYNMFSCLEDLFDGRKIGHAVALFVPGTGAGIGIAYAGRRFLDHIWLVLFLILILVFILSAVWCN